MDNGCIHSWAAPCTTMHTFFAPERESTRCRNLCGRSDPWTLAPPVGGQVASKQMLGTPHSTLHTPQREGRTLHRHLRPQALRIAEIFLTLSKEAHLETTLNQYSFGNIDNPEEARQSQHIQAQDLRKHRVRYTHVFNQHITTIREGSGYQNGWTVPKWLPTITLKSWHCQHCFEMCRQDLRKRRIRNTQCAQPTYNCCYKWLRCCTEKLVY